MRKKNRQTALTIFLLILTVVLFVICLGLVFCSTLTLELEMCGKENLTLDYGQTYTDEGAIAFVSSNLFKTLRVEIPVSVSEVPEQMLPGKTTVRYAANFLWHYEVVDRTITVVDDVAPVISLVSNPDSFTLPGQTYVEEGFTAIDNCDGDITHLVQRTVTENEVIYTVKDSSGNTAEVRRMIVYGDITAPELVLNGQTQITITAGTPYTELGFTATDNVDGDLTASVVIEGSVNIYSPGSYTLSYKVTDSVGNQTMVTRTVIVEAIRQPDVVNPGNKVIYLTFDDGPCSYTARLLEILAKYNVKATFFVTNQSKPYTYLIKDIVEQGHAIGIHTYTHVYSDIYSSKERFFADFNATRQLIYDESGVWTTLSRFPGGSGGRVSIQYCPGIMTELATDLTNMGYQYFDWNVSSGDTGTNKTPEAVAAAVIDGIKKRDVSCVLQHDIMSYSVDAVEQIIIWGLANGYTFLPLDSTSPTFHQTIRN